MSNIKLLLIGFTMALGAMPQMAQAQLLSDNFPLPVVCGEVEIGSPGCSFESVHNALNMVTPGYVRAYHEAGLESFAILAQLGEFKKIFDVIATDGDCILIDEGLYYSAEVLNAFLPISDDLPPSVPEALAQEYKVLDSFFVNAYLFSQKEQC